MFLIVAKYVVQGQVSLVSLAIAAGSDGALPSWGALLFTGEGVKVDMAGIMID